MTSPKPSPARRGFFCRGRPPVPAPDIFFKKIIKNFKKVLDKYNTLYYIVFEIAYGTFEMDCSDPEGDPGIRDTGSFESQEKVWTRNSGNPGKE
jgi:hypothetical protein